MQDFIQEYHDGHMPRQEFYRRYSQIGSRQTSPASSPDTLDYLSGVNSSPPGGSVSSGASQRGPGSSTGSRNELTLTETEHYIELNDFNEIGRQIEQERKTMRTNRLGNSGSPVLRGNQITLSAQKEPQIQHQQPRMNTSGKSQNDDVVSNTHNSLTYAPLVNESQNYSSPNNISRNRRQISSENVRVSPNMMNGSYDEYPLIKASPEMSPERVSMIKRFSELRDKINKASAKHWVRDNESPTVGSDGLDYEQRSAILNEIIRNVITSNNHDKKNNGDSNNDTNDTIDSMSTDSTDFKINLRNESKNERRATNLINNELNGNSPSEVSNNNDYTNNMNITPNTGFSSNIYQKSTPEKSPFLSYGTFVKKSQEINNNNSVLKNTGRRNIGENTVNTKISPKSYAGSKSSKQSSQQPQFLSIQQQKTFKPTQVDSNAEALYVRQMALRQQKTTRAIEMKKKLEERESSECTFRPSLETDTRNNRISRVSPYAQNTSSFNQTKRARSAGTRIKSHSKSIYSDINTNKITMDSTITNTVDNNNNNNNNNNTNTNYNDNDNDNDNASDNIKIREREDSNENLTYDEMFSSQEKEELSGIKSLRYGASKDSNADIKLPYYKTKQSHILKQKDSNNYSNIKKGNNNEKQSKRKEKHLYYYLASDVPVQSRAPLESTPSKIEKMTKLNESNQCCFQPVINPVPSFAVGLRKYLSQDVHRRLYSTPQYNEKGITSPSNPGFVGTYLNGKNNGEAPIVVNEMGQNTVIGGKIPSGLEKGNIPISDLISPKRVSPKSADDFYRRAMAERKRHQENVKEQQEARMEQIKKNSETTHTDYRSNKIVEHKKANEMKKGMPVTDTVTRLTKRERTIPPDTNTYSPNINKVSKKLPARSIDDLVYGDVIRKEYARARCQSAYDQEILDMATFTPEKISQQPLGVESKLKAFIEAPRIQPPWIVNPGDNEKYEIDQRMATNNYHSPTEYSYKSLNYEYDNNNENNTNLQNDDYNYTFRPEIHAPPTIVTRINDEIRRQINLNNLED